MMPNSPLPGMTTCFFSASERVASSTTWQMGEIGLLHRTHLLKSGLLVPHVWQMARFPGVSLGSYPEADPVAVALLSMEPGVAS